MNYLAHVLLSGEDPEVLVGNLMEDFIKGRIHHERNNHLSQKIKWGLELHRLIDSTIDSSPILKPSKQLFYPTFGKYTPSLIDILFDHFLSVNWKKYSTTDFTIFRKERYTTLEMYKSIYPPRMLATINSMIEHDWLGDYGNIDKLAFILERFSIKVGKSYNFVDAIPIMVKNYELIDDNFNTFFPQIFELCQSFLILKQNPKAE